MIRVKVPASIGNCGPGFDCIGLAVDMYNVVEMEWSDCGLTIEVDGEGSDDGSIPIDEGNVVYRAASLLFQRAGLPSPRLAIKLTNCIPLARGLGSSAAAIVGGLVASNELAARRFNVRLSDAQLFDLAASMEGHLDNVAAALGGGLTVSWTETGGPRFLRVPTPPLAIVIVMPDLKLETACARTLLPKEVSMGDAVFNIGRVALLVASVMTGRFDLLKAATEDRLHQPYRTPRVPGFREVTASAMEAGAYGAGLSGSGPSIFAFCAPERVGDVSSAMAESMSPRLTFRIWAGGIALEGAHLEV